MESVHDDRSWQGIHWRPIDNRSLVLFDAGDDVEAQAEEEGIRFLLVSGKPLQKPVAWFGPIVMYTREQLSSGVLQLEARLETVHPLVNRDRRYPVGIVAIEVRVVRVHAREDLVLNNHHINPAKWSPLIYNFRHYFGLGLELGKTFRSET